MARDLRLHDLAVVLQLSDSTLARIERGTHTPSLDTALALARWLGWTVEQVVDAARAPVDQSSEG